MNEYKYTLKDLLNAFEESGLVVSRSWLYNQEKKGRLTFPKSTTNIKKKGEGVKTGQVRVLTGKQMGEIVKAFMPGGRGQWHFKPQTT